jgi:hypothetical protein
MLIGELMLYVPGWMFTFPPPLPATNASAALIATSELVAFAWNWHAFGFKHTVVVVPTIHPSVERNPPKTFVAVEVLVKLPAASTEPVLSVVVAPEFVKKFVAAVIACHTMLVPFEVATVEDAPIVVSPVPPFAILNVPVTWVARFSSPPISLKRIVFHAASVPFDCKTVEDAPIVARPVPPPARVSVPESVGLNVKAPAIFVILIPDVWPFVTLVLVARVMAPVWAVPPPSCWSESSPLFVRVPDVPAIKLPSVPVYESPVPTVAVEVAVAYRLPLEFMFAVPAVSVEKIGATLNVCVLEKVFAVVVPKAEEITGVAPPLESIG